MFSLFTQFQSMNNVNNFTTPHGAAFWVKFFFSLLFCFGDRFQKVRIMGGWCSQLKINWKTMYINRISTPSVEFNSNDWLLFWMLLFSSLRPRNKSESFLWEWSLTSRQISWCPKTHGRREQSEENKEKRRRKQRRWMAKGAIRRWNRIGSSYVMTLCVLFMSATKC